MTIKALDTPWRRSFDTFCDYIDIVCDIPIRQRKKSRKTTNKFTPYTSGYREISFKTRENLPVVLLFAFRQSASAICHGQPSCSPSLYEISSTGAAYTLSNYSPMAGPSKII